jgi:hypothetical protein
MCDVESSMCGSLSGNDDPPNLSKPGHAVKGQVNVESPLVQLNLSKPGVLKGGAAPLVSYNETEEYKMNMEIKKNKLKECRKYFFDPNTAKKGASIVIPSREQLVECGIWGECDDTIEDAVRIWKNKRTLLLRDYSKLVRLLMDPDEPCSKLTTDDKEKKDARDKKVKERRDEKNRVKEEAKKTKKKPNKRKRQKSLLPDSDTLAPFQSEPGHIVKGQAAPLAQSKSGISEMNMMLIMREIADIKEMRDYISMLNEQIDQKMINLDELILAAVNKSDIIYINDDDNVAG